MEVSVEVTKLLNVLSIYSTAFFTSGGGADVLLVRLSLIKHIIKDANLMSISFSEFAQCDQNYFQYLYIPI